jgi:hypothetical protein
LLNESSFDTRVSGLGRRYDHYTNEDSLAQRDLNDAKLVELCTQLVEVIDGQIDLDKALIKFPLKYKQPLNNLVNRELHLFKVLLNTIKQTVSDFILCIHATYNDPLLVEAQWQQIHQN